MGKLKLEVFRQPINPNRSSNNHRGRDERNMPTVLRNDASTSRNRASASSSTAPPPPSAIETLRFFLISRYSEADNMLNLEHMADDIALKAAGLKSPGEKGAPSNVAGAMWKLAGSLFPNVRILRLLTLHQLYTKL
jgi:nuclear RNA export factor